MKIEKNIPIPPAHKQGKFYTVGKDMEVGDSVLVEDFSQAQALGNSVRREGGKVAHRKDKENGGYRVWRVA